MKFIVFEGGEGSGKSTHMRLTQQWLATHGITAGITHEPGGTEIGAQIRNLILSSSPQQPVYQRAEALLFMADRAQHIEETIQPVIAGTSEYDVILCDRFSGSTFAYQVGGRGLNEQEIAVLDAYARNGVEPDVVVYLDVDPTIGLSRKDEQGGDEITNFEREELEFHQRVRSNFIAQAAANDDWEQIDGSGSIEQAQSAIEAYLGTVLDQITSNT